jgi:hypothetical protein
MQEAWVAGVDDEAEAADADTDEGRRDTEELMAVAEDETVEAREAELLPLEAELKFEDRDMELKVEDETELAGRDVELETLDDTDRDTELDGEVDNVEVEAGTEEEGVTMTPLTFLGIANAPVPDDRYRATLFH